MLERSRHALHTSSIPRNFPQSRSPLLPALARHGSRASRLSRQCRGGSPRDSARHRVRRLPHSSPVIGHPIHKCRTNFDFADSEVKRCQIGASPLVTAIGQVPPIPADLFLQRITAPWTPSNPPQISTYFP